MGALRKNMTDSKYKVYVTSQQCPPAYSKPSNMILQSQVCELREWCKHFGFGFEVKGVFILNDTDAEYLDTYSYFSGWLPLKGTLEAISI